MLYVLNDFLGSVKTADSLLFVVLKYVCHQMSRMLVCIGGLLQPEDF